MKKITTLITAIALVLSLCCCSKEDNSSILSTQEKTAVIATSKTNETSILNEPAETDLEHALNLLTDSNNNFYSRLLYDFDMDGIPELVELQFGLEDYYANIYNLLGDMPEFIGQINCHNPIIKYYDKNNDCYFYLTHCESGGSGHFNNCSEILEFFSDGVICKTIASTSCYVLSETSYYIYENWSIGKDNNYTGYFNLETQNINEINSNALHSFLLNYEAVDEINFISIVEDENYNWSDILNECKSKYSDYSTKPPKYIKNNVEYIEFNDQKIYKYATHIVIDLTEANENIDFNLLNQFPNLKAVELYSNNDNFKNYNFLPLISNKNIKSLSVQGEMQCYLNELSQMSFVEHLEISFNNKIDTDTIELISHIASLKTIYFGSSILPSPDLFTPLYSAKNLDVIALNGMENVLTDTQKNNLLENIPDCMIVYIK